MKRSWIGFFLLLVLLGLGFLTTWAMEEVHTPISESLEQAAGYSLENNWHGAAWSTARARGNWEKWKLLRASLADHVPIEEIDALFQVLEVYGVAREEVAFAALCREMAQKIEALGLAQGLEFENLL